MVYSEFAPAKINLFLDVLCKRPDGYHDIGTLFQTIGVGDHVRAESNQSGEITLSYDRPQSYPLQSDLVYKAAILLRKEYQVSMGARIHLQKYLPLGAGLGGGSADAAAALRLLNRIWGLGVEIKELERLGAQLGADVPFLVAGGSALATGIGDELELIAPIGLPAKATLLVATPHCAVPTVAAYAGIVPSGAHRWDVFKQHCQYHSQKLDIFDSRFVFFNKFEESVFPAYPQIMELKKLFLEKGAICSLMSGSGASVFGIFDSPGLAEKTLRELQSLVRWGCTTQFFFPNIEI